MATNTQIKGLDQLQAKMSKLLHLKDELKKTTQKAVLYVEGEVPPYPSGPWRREGLLGRSMTSEVRELGSEIVGVIGNNTVYAPWVISSEKIGNRGPQRDFHGAHGWYTLQGVIQKAKNGVIQIYENWIKGLIE